MDVDSKDEFERSAANPDFFDGPSQNVGPEDRYGQADALSLEALSAQLDMDSSECWQAFQGLAALDGQTQLRLVRAIAESMSGQGADTLLRLLSGSNESAVRVEAQAGLDRRLLPLPTSDTRAVKSPYPPKATSWISTPTTYPGARPTSELAVRDHPSYPWLARSMVTTVDGEGRGAIVVSAIQETQRRTAAFLCDLQRGIVDVIGTVEEDSEIAGSLVERIKREAEGESVEVMPELARALLAGCWMMDQAGTSPAVVEWLKGTLGNGFRPHPFPPAIPDREDEARVVQPLKNLAEELFEACPSWLDGSPLTFELAEEIFLREGKPAVDPEREAGACRYLFEHRLMGRLELYRRMLLWMSWIWRSTGESTLARTAEILAWQLSDEQYAVPSHPFTVALTTRSLLSAQHLLGTTADPRPAQKGCRRS
jgi:hypothetical protein